MEISAEKTKLMVNSHNDIQRQIKVKGQKLRLVERFKYLETVAQNLKFFYGLQKPLQLCIKLKLLWTNNNTSLESKVKLMCFLVLFVFLYACKSWI